MFSDRFLCLLQVVESTGAVVKPYLEYPQLLAILLRMLNEGTANRTEVLKVRLPASPPFFAFH